MWTEQRTLRLIDLYKERRSLWDPKHPHYYNKILKNDTWEELATEMNSTSEECRKKIFGLQSSLRREKWKIRRSQGKGSDEAYVSSWFAFRSLSFLLDTDRARLAATETKESDDLHTKERSSDELTVKQPPNKKLKTTDNTSANKETSTTTSSIRPDDEDISQLFGNLVAKRMRMYSPLVQSAVQQAVMNVLFNADRGYYDQKSSSPNFDPSFPQQPQCIQGDHTSQHCNIPSHSLYASLQSSSPTAELDQQECKPSYESLQVSALSTDLENEGLE